MSENEVVYVDVPMPTGGLRFNEGKPRASLFDQLFLWGVTKVLEFGAKKYAVNNWRKGLLWSACLDSMDRHLLAWKQGEDLDPESGIHHLDHVGCNVMFLRRYAEGGYESFDDRKERFAFPDTNKKE